MKLQKGHRITKDTICRINVKCRIKSSFTKGCARLTWQNAAEQDNAKKWNLDATKKRNKRNVQDKEEVK